MRPFNDPGQESGLPGAITILVQAPFWEAWPQKGYQQILVD